MAFRILCTISAVAELLVTFSFDFGDLGSLVTNGWSDWHAT